MPHSQKIHGDAEWRRLHILHLNILLTRINRLVPHHLRALGIVVGTFSLASEYTDVNHQLFHWLSLLLRGNVIRVPSALSNPTSQLLVSIGSLSSGGRVPGSQRQSCSVLWWTQCDSLRCLFGYRGLGYSLFIVVARWRWFCLYICSWTFVGNYDSEKSWVRMKLCRTNELILVSRRRYWWTLVSFATLIRQILYGLLNVSHSFTFTHVVRLACQSVD